MYASKWLEIGSEEVVVRQGEKGEGMFFLVEGVCVVKKEIKMSNKGMKKLTEMNVSPSSSSTPSSSSSSSLPYTISQTYPHSHQSQRNKKQKKQDDSESKSTSSSSSTSFTSSHQSPAPVVHPPHIQSLELASLSFGEYFGAESLFSPASAAESARFNQISVTVSTSSRCRLLYVQAEKMKAILPEKVLQKLKRLYAQVRSEEERRR